MRTLLRLIWFALLLLAALPLAAQSIPPGCYFDQQTESIICPEPKAFECTAQASATPTIRAEGATELLAPLTIQCTGGNPTPVGGLIPQATITVTLGPNVNVTSKLLDPGGATEALLLLDEPSPSAQYVCETSTGTCPAYGNGTGTGYYGGGTQSSSVPNNRNVFQGFLTGPNTLVFRNIPFDPPGQTNSRTFSFQNIRVNASQLTVPVGGGAAVTASISLSGQQITIADSTQTLGIARASTRTAVRDANNTSDAPSGLTAMTTSAGTRVRVGTIRLTEISPVVLRQRTTAAASDANTAPAPAPQNQPGVNPRSESGFYNPTFPNLAGRGNLGLAGLADSGTRVRAVFTQVPNGVTLYVGTTNDNSNTEWAPRFASTRNPLPLVQFDPGSVTQLPSLRATPTSLAFTLLQGTNSTAQSVLLEALLATVPQNVAFTATPGTAFPLQVNPVSGRTPTTMAVTAGAGSLPPGKYTASITVTAAGVTNSPLVIPVELTVTGRLQITSITPSTVTAGRPAFDMTVAGAGFASGAQVVMGGQALTPTSNTSTQLVVRVPASIVASPGSVPVSVVNPDQSESNTVQLTVLPAPVLTQLNPSAVAPNTAVSVAVIGRNLTRDLAIQVQGATVPSTFVDATRINASIPASALPAGVASVNVSGLTGDGVSTNALPLTLQSALTLISGPVQAGDRSATASIRGTALATGSRVEATPPGGQPTTITPDAVSATSVDFTLPGTLLTQAGAMSIRLLPPGGAASAPLTLTIQPAPRITSLSPSARPVGGTGFTLTVTGTDFLAGSTVRWNTTGLAASGSGTSLTADVAASLIATRIPVNVTVEGPGGATSNAVPFDITLPTLPSLNYGGLNVATSGTRADATLTLGAAFPAALRVQFTLTFAPDGNLPNDRAIVFTNGQRQIDVNIPSGSTAPAQVAFQTGSTAGVVTLTPRFFAGSTDVTPSGVQSRTITIARAAPIVAAADVRCVRSSGTQLTITVSGISNTREVSRSTFDFVAAGGETLSSSSFPIDTAAMFANWFNSANGQLAGGTFLYTQNFNVSPSSSGVASVGVTLTNAAGASTARTAQCTQ